MRIAQQFTRADVKKLAVMADIDISTESDCGALNSFGLDDFINLRIVKCSHIRK